MARKTSKFLVGLFTTLGVILGVVAIIWVGASKYFEKGKTYVTYFDESVQGLQKDSAVKYRGVDVGRVETIRVAPDNRLIAVVMKVNLKEDLTQTAVAQLKVAGITGIVFVELDRIKPGEAAQSPKINFPAEYPVIASRPSEVAKILAGVNVMVDKLNQIDFPGIINQLRDTAKEVQIFFRGKKMESILTKLEASLANTQAMTARLNRIVGNGDLDTTLADTKNTVKATRILVENLNDEVKGLKLQETLGKTRTITTDLGATSENLRRTSEMLEAFVGRIKDRPSDLLFGKPPRGRWNE